MGWIVELHALCREHDGDKQQCIVDSRCRECDRWEEDVRVEEVTAYNTPSELGLAHKDREGLTRV